MKMFKLTKLKNRQPKIILLILVCVQFTTGIALAEDYFLSANEKTAIAIGLKLKEVTPEARSEAIIKIKEKWEAFQQEKKIVPVEKYKDFLSTFTQNEFFLENSLKSLSIETLLDKISVVEYTSTSPVIQKKINKYLQDRKLFIEKSILAGLVYLSQSEFLKKIITEDPAAIKNFNTEIKKEITTHINSYLDNMSVDTSPQTEVLSRLLKSYFLYLPERQKNEIVFQFTQLPLSATADDLFMVFIQTSGPQLQKLIQIIGRSPEIPEKYRKLFQRLESEVKPIPWKVTHAFLQQDGINISEDFSYFERKPLGVGTMAQTHRVQLMKNGERQSLVLRFLKPDMATLLEIDRMILQNVALEIDSDPTLKKYNLPSLGKLIDDLNKSIVEELDVEKTVLAQVNGQKIYNRQQLIQFNNQKNFLNLHVPNAQLIGRTKTTMLQELVFGKKPTKVLTEYKELYPDLYKKVSEAMAIHWVDEAFFTSGFFHADLHQGNILLQMTDEQIHLNILDFGMTGQLTKTLRESALLLAVGIRLNHAELIAKHFKNLSKAKTLPADFAEKCAQRVKSSTAGTDYSISDWTTWALDNGLEMNYEFLKLNRGMKAIEILLQDSKSALSFEKIALNILKHRKIYVSQLVFAEKLLRSADIKDLFKIGVDSIFFTEIKSDKIKNKQDTKKDLTCTNLF